MTAHASLPLDHECPISPRPAVACAHGFTLVELIMVLVLLGVLAVYAVPRVLNTGDFFARGFHDQSLAYLRYAQKTAIAQRRTVCVVVGASTITLSMANAAASINCPTALPGPSGEFNLAARNGVSFASGTGSFNFDALGQPLNADGTAAATRVLQVGNVSRSITVESATGFVHE